MVHEFINDDEGYQRWAQNHPTGFVINTPKSKPSNDMKLHYAACQHIRLRKNRPLGAFIARQYIKTRTITPNRRCHGADIWLYLVI
jgi:hypothetical protein